MKLVVIVVFIVACSTNESAPVDAAPDVCEQLIPDATQYACDAIAPDAEGCIGDPNDPGASSSSVYPIGCTATLPRPSAFDSNCRLPGECGCHPQPAQCEKILVDAAPQWLRPL